MHIMVNKRYRQNCDTCVGHEARIYKLLIKKPPGIMSAGSASSVCEQSFDKENFYKQLFTSNFLQKSIILGRTEHKLEIKALSMKVT